MHETDTEELQRDAPLNVDLCSAGKGESGVGIFAHMLMSFQLGGLLMEFKMPLYCFSRQNLPQVVSND